MTTQHKMEEGEEERLSLDGLRSENPLLLSCESTASYSTGFLQYPSPPSVLQTSGIKLPPLPSVRLYVGILLPSNCGKLLHQKTIITREAS